jgi:hypothetical protein
MQTKSAIDQFANAIIAKISLYLTTCLGVLLITAALLRQLHQVDERGLPAAAEVVVLLLTLIFTYIAIRLAGFLAVESSKRDLLQQKLTEDKKPENTGGGEPAMISEEHAALQSEASPAISPIVPRSLTVDTNPSS